MMLSRSCFCVLVLAATPAVAQPVNRPIDQGVEDVDPRAVSFRVMDPGNAQYPTRSMVVERAHTANWSQLGLPVLDRVTGTADTHRYEYRSPGVRARMDRPDYLVIDQTGEPALNTQPIFDGAFVELPPPNTVYDLVPAAPRPIDPAAVDPNWRDPRVDGRLDNRAGQGFGHYHPGTLHAPTAADRQPQVQRFEIRRLHAKRYADTPAPAGEQAPATSKDEADAKSEPQE